VGPSAATEKANQSLKTIVGGSEVDASSPLARTVLSYRTIIGGLPSDESDDDTGEGIRIAQCSAAALTRKLVLTAAHCVRPATTGTIEFKDADGTEMSINVEKATVIEDYSYDKTADLAILTLATELPSFVQTIALPDINSDIDLLKTGMVAAGYGRNIDVKPFKGAGVLRSVTVKVEQYSLSSNSIIVDQVDGTGICQGDSGGPGLVEFDGKMYAIGVASKTLYMPVEGEAEQHTCRFKGVYVNLMKFKPWIEKTVAALQQGS
jgi:secreted trypsin-like serine protease